jgi:hypothetical protein
MTSGEAQQNTASSVGGSQQPTFNKAKVRWELRMPCGRLLFCKGSRHNKAARRNLRGYNVPLHRGRCWKCAALYGFPKARILARLRMVFDSAKGVKFGMFTDQYESANAKAGAEPGSPEVKHGA